MNKKELSQVYSLNREQTPYKGGEKKMREFAKEEIYFPKLQSGIVRRACAFIIPPTSGGLGAKSEPSLWPLP